MHTMTFLDVIYDFSTFESEWNFRCLYIVSKENSKWNETLRGSVYGSREEQLVPCFQWSVYYQCIHSSDSDVGSGEKSEIILGRLWLMPTKRLPAIQLKDLPRGHILRFRRNELIRNSPATSKSSHIISSLNYCYPIAFMEVNDTPTTSVGWKTNPELNRNPKDLMFKQKTSTKHLVEVS